MPSDNIYWPKWAWGQMLGVQAINIRCGTTTLSVAELKALTNMGMKWNPKGCPRPKAHHPWPMVVPLCSLQATYQEQIVHEKMRLEIIQKKNRSRTR